MSSASTTLSTPVLKKAIDRYHKQLEDYKGKVDYELAFRTAFLNLLNETAHQVKWMLIPEQTIEGNIRPDGVLRDSFDLKRGFWEAKEPKSDLDKEIATGYPLTNTIFENTKRAILFQNKKRAFEYDLHNPTEVGDLLAPIRQVGRFLDEVYMYKRIHSSLGYLTPAEFESQWRGQQEH